MVDNATKEIADMFGTEEKIPRQFLGYNIQIMYCTRNWIDNL